MNDEELYVLSDGKPVGTLFLRSGHLTFRYMDGAAPLSLHLPCPSPVFYAGFAFWDEMAEDFFMNLLPQTQKWSGKEAFELFRRFGSDLAGELYIETACAKERDIDRETEMILGSVAKDTPFRKLGWQGLLPGVDDQIAVVAKNVSRCWLLAGMTDFCEPSAQSPSSHIVRKDDVLNEAYCARLAALCGLPVKFTDIFMAGDRFALLAERTDRSISEYGHVSRVKRRDFHQLAGVSGRRELEAKDIAKLLPESEVPAFLRASFFSLVIGANDSGYSLLFEGEKEKLSPLHGIVSSSAKFFHQHGDLLGRTLLSRMIGKAKFACEVLPDDLEAYAATFSVDAREAADLFGEIVENVSARAEEAGKSLRERIDKFESLATENAKATVAFLESHIRRRAESFFAKLAKDFRALCGTRKKTLPKAGLSL